MKFTVVSQETTEVLDTNPNLYVERAEDFLKKGNFRKAVEEINLAVNYAQSNKEEYLYQKVKILDAVKHTNECTATIRANVKRFYDNFSLNKFEEILRYYERAAGTGKNAVKMLLQVNKVPVVLAETYQEIKSKDREYFLSRANSYYLKGSCDIALEFCDFTVKRFHGGTDVYILMADAFFELRKYEDAITYYDKVISSDYSDIRAYTNIVKILGSLNRYEQALEYCEKAVSRNPQKPELMVMKAEVFFKLRRFRECINCYTLALNMAPSNSAYIYFEIGKAHDALKEYWSANSFYKKALRSNPSYKIPYNEDRIRFLRRLKLSSIAASIFLAVILTGQFILFTNGVFSSEITDLNVYIGEKVLLVNKSTNIRETHKLFPFYGKEPGISYAIENPEVAALDSDGTIKGIKEGRAVINILSDGRVLDKKYIDVIIPKLQTFKLDIKNTPVKIGDSTVINSIIEMNHKDAEKPIVSFKSTDTKVVNVDSRGVVNATGLGSAEIIATAGDKELRILCNIKPFLQDLMVENSQISVEAGQKVKINAAAVMLPKEAAAPKISFLSGDTKNTIINVSEDGTVEGLREGNTQVLVSCGDLKSYIAVNVTKKPVVGQISFTETKYEIEEGQSIKLGVEVKMIPEGSKVPEMKFSDASYYQGLVEIGQDGTVKALKTGYAKIKVECGDKYAQVDVTVIRKSITKLKVTGLKVASAEGLDYKLTWDAVQSGIYYNVYTKEKHKGSTEFKLYQTVSSNSISFSIDLDEDSEFYVKAAYSRYDEEESAPSNIVAIKAPVFKVSGVMIGKSKYYSQYYNISWDSLGSDFSYRIYVKRKSSGDTSFKLMRSTSSYNQDFSVTSNEDSEFYVVGVYNGRETGPSDIVNLKLP
jgi:tetratricopeptide (TPR) repeat protein